jgi:hypothetical protein
MKQFLLGAAVASAVLGAAGFAVTKAPAAAKGSGPLKLSDLTLDRAFRYEFPAAPVSAPTVIPFPPTQGFVLTRIESRVAVNQAVPIVFFSLNGGPQQSVATGAATTGGIPVYYLDGIVDPPLVIRPGDLLSIWSPNPGLPMTIGGYIVYPGEV